MPQDLYGAIDVKLSSSSISLFDRPATSPRPDLVSLAAARSGGQGWAKGPSRSDLPLTVASTVAGLADRGVETYRFLRWFGVGNFDGTEGSSPSGAEIAPQTCIRPIREDRNHDAVMRIGGEAPRRRAHSKPRLEGHSPISGCRHLGPSFAARRRHDTKLRELCRRLPRR